MSMERPCVLVGVTGCIAAYKACEIVRGLQKAGVRVKVVMTEHGTHFVDPVTFRALTHEKVAVGLFDDPSDPIHHISLAQECDVFLIAPCTANVMAKVACGIADDLLSTTALATTATLAIAPAANVHMYEAAATQANMATLRSRGVRFIEGDAGYLACGDTGEGKMPEPELLFEYIVRALYPKDMQGISVLVTAGATREKIDPVRYITNHSTGKMGYAIARAAMLRGAKVTLVSGKTELEPPMGVHVIDVESAADMAEAVKAHAKTQDMIIKAAAVADYRPKHAADEKVKKKDDEMSLELERTEDILGYLGSHKMPGQFLCGFSMETEHMLENSRKKLEKKNLDLIVANNLKQEGAGFGTDTNIVTLISEEDTVQLPLMSKEEVADRLLSYIIGKRKHKNGGGV